MEQGQEELEQALMELAEELARKQQEEEDTKRETYDKLANSIESKLVTRMGTRGRKESEWMEALQLYYGSLSSNGFIEGDYPARQAAERTRDNRRPEINIVRNKCETAISQTIAYQFAAGDKNWDINPPAKYDDLDQKEYEEFMWQQSQQQGPPQQQQQQDPNQPPPPPPPPPDPAKFVAHKADLMAKTIESQLTRTKYASECRAAMWDRVVLGTGVMRGPLNSGEPKKVYLKQTTTDGRIIRVPSITLEKVPSVRKVNLWYWFPDDSVVKAPKAEDSIEIHPMSGSDLRELSLRDDFFKEEIDECLEEDVKTYNANKFMDSSFLMGGKNSCASKFIVAEYHGPIQIDDLQNIGVNYDVDTPYKEIYAEVWVCNGRVIKFALSNLEGYNQIPYCVSTWEPDPSSIFGFGIPLLIADSARVVKETYKMMLDNAGISAGPQVIIDTTLIKPQDNKMELTPFKVWVCTDYGADVTNAIKFFTPPNQFEGLPPFCKWLRGSEMKSQVFLLCSPVRRHRLV